MLGIPGSDTHVPTHLHHDSVTGGGFAALNVAGPHLPMCPRPTLATADLCAVGLAAPLPGCAGIIQRGAFVDVLPSLRDRCLRVLSCSRGFPRGLGVGAAPKFMGVLPGAGEAGGGGIIARPVYGFQGNQGTQEEVT